jgi:hypothetical protein
VVLFQHVVTIPVWPLVRTVSMVVVAAVAQLVDTHMCAFPLALSGALTRRVRLGVRPWSSPSAVAASPPRPVQT